MPIAQRYVPVIAGRKPLRLSPHMRFVGLGDSITSQSSSKGFINWLNQTSLKLGGIFKPSIAADQGVGGNTMTQISARIGFTTGQYPELVFLMAGHNDGMATALATLNARWDLIVDAIWAANPRTVIVAHGCLPSTVENTGPLQQNLVDFNAHMLARQNLVANTNFPLIYIPVPPTWNPTIAVHTADGTHPNPAGAAVISNNAVVTLMPMINWINVLTQVSPPADFGSNLDTETAFTGTGGTKTGTTTPTGNVATGKEVNNATNGAVACDNQTTAGDQRISVTGAITPSAVVTWDEAASSNVTISSAIGDIFEWLMGIDISATDGSSISDGLTAVQTLIANFGTFGSSVDPTTGDFDSTLAAAVMRTYPVTVYIATSTLSPAFSARFSASTADTRITLRNSVVRKCEQVAYGLPFYVGSDTLKGANSQQTLTGTGVSGSNITAATVATLTLRPGDWAGGAIVWTREMRINGTPVGGAFTSAWTYNATGTLTAGQTVAIDCTATNSFGAVTRTLTFTVV